MEIQLLVVLIIAFIVLGPERMIDLAVRLGEATRKVREVWDEVRMQAYMEEVNRKIMEEEEEEEESLPHVGDEDYNEDYLEEHSERSGSKEGKPQNGRRRRPAPDDAPDRTSEGAEDKTD